MRHRHELADAQWQRIESLLSGKAAEPGRTAADNRLFVNAALFVLKIGILLEGSTQNMSRFVSACDACHAQNHLR